MERIVWLAEETLASQELCNPYSKLNMTVVCREREIGFSGDVCKYTVFLPA